MQRAGLLVFVILVLSVAPLKAQKVSGSSPGGAVHISGGRGGGMGTKNDFPRRSGFRRHSGYGAIWLPLDAPYWDADGYLGDESFYQQPANPVPPQVTVVENKEPRPPVPTAEPPKLIEVPQSNEVPVAKQQPPTLFVLKDGGRIESRYYLISDHSLQIQVSGQQRTIPVSTLDLDATIAANHERGVDVIIPRDRSTLFLGF